MTLIGITGKARSGKDTAGLFFLREHWFDVTSFAEPIKRGVQAAFSLKPDDIYENREEIIPHIGKSKRQLYQLFGTEFGRDIIHPDLWINIAQHKLDAYIHSQNTNPGHLVDSPGLVFTDVRFDNEAQFIKRNGGFIIDVQRDVSNYQVSPHTSEDGINKIYIDFTVKNNSTVTAFYQQLHETLMEIHQCKKQSAA